MSLRILNIGGPYLASALKRLGHHVITAHPAADADIPSPHPYSVRQLLNRLDALGFAPDALFYCDDGNMPELLDPENAPWPSGLVVPVKEGCLAVEIAPSGEIAARREG